MTDVHMCTGWVMCIRYDPVVLMAYAFTHGWSLWVRLYLPLCWCVHVVRQMEVLGADDGKVKDAFEDWIHVVPI
jgi:hypothetical protein